MHLDQPAKSQMSLGSDRSALKILLAEDNLINQKVALKQLESLGYGATVVENGQGAVEAVMQTQYDLVLMDCQMPVLNGYEATQAIRAWEQQQEPRQRLIIIAMTASGFQHDQTRSIEAGMDDFVSKPVRRDTLSVLLQRWSQVIQAAQVKQPAPFLESVHSQAPPELEILQSQLDWQQLHLLSDNNFEFEMELLQLFTQDSLRHLERLKQAIAEDDLQQIEQIAHHIKGASANVGASLMYLAADQIERRAWQKQLDGVDESISQLALSLEQIQRFTDHNPPLQASSNPAI